jgi:hypothetical protein
MPLIELRLSLRSPYVPLSRTYVESEPAQKNISKLLVQGLSRTCYPCVNNVKDDPQFLFFHPFETHQNLHNSRRTLFYMTLRSHILKQLV